MVFGAAGLRTHIWNNNLRSIVLLAGFPILLVLIGFALVILKVLDRTFSTVLLSPVKFPSNAICTGYRLIILTSVVYPFIFGIMPSSIHASLLIPSDVLARV